MGTYVRPLHAYTRAACERYEHDLTARAHLDTFMVVFLSKILQFQVVLVLVVNSESFQKSYVHCMREQERDQHAAETAEHRQERLTKTKERDRAGHSTLTAAAEIFTNLRLCFSVASQLVSA